MTLGDWWGAELSPSGFDLAVAQAADSAAPGIVEYARQIQAIGESLVEAINRARMSVAMTDAQRDLLNIQLTRLQQGLPPLSTGATNPGSITLDSSALMWAAVGVGAVLLLRKR